METETKATYVFRHWHENRQIVIFAAQLFTRQTMDVLADWVIETVSGWDRGSPLMIGYDVSNLTLLTPHMIQRSMDIYHAVPIEGIIGRTAIIVGHTRLGMFVTNFAERIMKVQNPSMLRQFFTDQQKAVDWLSSELATLKPEMPTPPPAQQPAPETPAEETSENPPTP
jgi:hypothetical protein